MRVSFKNGQTSFCLVGNDFISKYVIDYIYVWSYTTLCFMVS